MHLLKPSCHIALMLAASFVMALPLAAQETGGCRFAQVADGPPRQKADCGTGLRFEREPAAALRIIERTGEAAPRAIEVNGGAILIDVTPGTAPTQVRTPHAIATVRGTTYIVDAGADSTSVFVLEGRVSVRRVNNASTVILTAGEGVDVGPETPLEVTSWGAARAAALMARFDR